MWWIIGGVVLLLLLLFCWFFIHGADAKNKSSEYRSKIDDEQSGILAGMK